MANQTVSGFDAVMKIVYEGKLREILNRKSWVLSVLNRSPRQYEGKQVTYPINLRRNPAFGARADGGTLPSRGSQTYDDTAITVKYLYLRGGLTGPTIRAVKSQKGGFASALAAELNLAIKDFRKELNFIGWGDGTGTRCLADESVTSATLTVKSAGQSTPDVGAPGTRYLREGMTVLVGTAAEISAGTAEAMTVSSITDHDTVVFTASGTFVTGDIIVEGDASGNSYSNVPMGMLGIIDDDTGTFQGISRTTYGIWKGTVLGNSSTLRDFSDELLQRAFDYVSRRTGAQTDILVMDPSVRRMVIDQIIPDRRYTNRQYDKGWGYLSYDAGDGEVRIYADTDCPFHRIFGIDSSTIQTYVQADIHFADDDNHLLRNVANTDAWEYLLRADLNFGSDNPAANFVIEDVTSGAIDLT